MASGGGVRSSTAALCLLCVAVAPAEARADAVSAPTSCPRGSVPRFSHWTGYCGLPPTCKMSDDCAADAEPPTRCESHDLCVDRVRGRNDKETEVVIGPCGADRSCAKGACVQTNGCVPTPSDEDPSAWPSGGAPRGATTAPRPDAAPLPGCGCAVPGLDEGATSLAGFGVAAVALWRRRRVPR